MFEDLIPKKTTAPKSTSSVGLFDDLIPGNTAAKYGSSAKPGFVRGVAGDIVKPFDAIKNTATAFGGGAIARAADVVSSKVTGNPQLYSSYKDAVNKVDPSKTAPGQDISSKLTGENSVTRDISTMRGVRQTAGDILQAASNFIPLAKGATGIKALAKVGAKTGATYGAGQEFSKDGAVTPTGLLKATAVGTAVGAAGGAAFGSVGPVIGAANKSLQRFTKPEEFATRKVDSAIRNIYKDTTADVGQINEAAFKVKKGLEALQTEAPNIKIPDAKAPLGTTLSKPLNLAKAKPNELISALTEMDKKITSNARTAAQEAANKGLKIDVEDAQTAIFNAVQKGEIPNAAGIRLQKQVDALNNDPVAVHDWVESVNSKFGNKYEKGTIDDMATSKIADEIASTFRTKLDDIVDRKGYAEAFANNKELKRALVLVAQKANKKVNFGDIATDSGLDAAIALITANPAYLARTLGTGLFKGMLSSVRNKSGINSVKSAIKNIPKTGVQRGINSSELKPYQSQSTVQGEAASQVASMPKVTSPGNIKQATKYIPDTKKNSNLSISKTLPQAVKKSSSLENVTVDNLSTKDNEALNKWIFKKPEPRVEAAVGDVKKKVEQAKLNLELMKDARIPEAIKDLAKYESKTGSYKGMLRFEDSELLKGKTNSKFAKSYDDILNNWYEEYFGSAEGKTSDEIIETYNKIKESYRSTLSQITNLQKEKVATKKQLPASSIADKVKSHIKETIDEIKKRPTAGFMQTAYRNEGELTTKILKDLEGKTTVSKQYILDATNRGELKQVERDITRQVLDTMPDGQINVKEFADKVKSELLPLKVNTHKGGKRILEDDPTGRSANGLAFRGGRYESVNLPSEIRGNVKNYAENIYESPIKTSAGNTHFSGDTDNYFGHTRIEDMADDKTRRVIEVQSDLYQKGNLEKEVALPNRIKRPQIEKEITDLEERIASEGGKFSRESDIKSLNEWKKTLSELNAGRGAEVAKLQQYNDPTAHFRMIREEIKKAAEDGKTKLQFPTGETAMKVEGLGNRDNWLTEQANSSNIMQWKRINESDLSVGMKISQPGSGSSWIVTDVLGDGKFKAVPKSNITTNTLKTLQETGKLEGEGFTRGAIEEFDISGKVDTNNPIYKFYEKDVQKYLNKFGGKQVVDDKGVSWIEIPISKEQGKMPVEAFGKVMPSVPVVLGAGTAALYGASKLPSALKGDTKSYQRDSSKDKMPIDLEKATSSIKYNETRGEKNPYEFYRFSGDSKLGDALGAYQVTEGELKLYSERFLNKKVTREDFLNSRKLQDDYIKGKVKWLESKGLTIEEILAAHRGGFSDFSKKRDKVKQYAQYVQDGLEQYSK